MGRTNFENLRVYRLSENLAQVIWTVAARWDNFNRDTLGKQLVRSADSIGANIAEGAGRYSGLDNRRFCYIARGSLNETKHWLRQAYLRKLLTTEEIEQLKDILEELSPKLNSYINSIRPDLKRSRKTATNNDQPATNTNRK